MMYHKGHNDQQSPYIPYPAHANHSRYCMPSRCVVDARLDARERRTVPQIHIQPEPTSNDNTFPPISPIIRLPNGSQARDMRVLKPALKHVGQKPQVTTQGKCVHWTDAITPCQDFGRYRRRFVRQCPPRHIMTAPFTVSFHIGGDHYTVHLEPVEATADLLMKFQNELERCVADSQKPMLRLAMSRGYSLTFHRLLRTSTAKVEDPEDFMREATFNGFINAVFAHASVTMEWL
jgi:hypothetical protein